MSSIFLSHNHEDKPFARRLSERLQAHGIHTWLDEAEIQVGDSLIAKISSAIQECAYLGIILSPHSVTSEWVRREVNLALTEEIEGERVKVLPLLYQKCEIPGFLADKLYADFTKDFEEGFEKLLARLTADLHQAEHKQKRAYKIFQAAYRDWLSFGKQDTQLLDQNIVTLVLQHLVRPRLSLDLMEYLFGSVAYWPERQNLPLTHLKGWLDEIGAQDAKELFERLLSHPTPRVRQGTMVLVERLEERQAIATIISHLQNEANRDVKRAGLRYLSQLKEHLPTALAQAIFDTNEDWLIRSYALQSLDGYRSGVLISDETDFAAQLGAIAQSSGFLLMTLTPANFWEIEEIETEALKAHELLILVRGEHFTQFGNETFYSKVRRFVAEGGSLLATSWVSWETKYQQEFASILPFTHIQDTYNEDVTVTCKPTATELAQKLFPKQVSFRTSFELLQSKEGSVVLFETDTGIPIFGYRRFGAGICYYLNTCQHSCLGPMPSPLNATPELQASLERVFHHMYQNPRHPQ